jgi:hypothetical protein
MFARQQAKLAFVAGKEPCGVVFRLEVMSGTHTP